MRSTFTTNIELAILCLFLACMHTNKACDSLDPFFSFKKLEDQ